MILGEQGLRQIKATLNFFEDKLYYQIPELHKIHHTNDNSVYQNEIDNLMRRNVLIAETLPFTTTIQATIRTKN